MDYKLKLFEEEKDKEEYYEKKENQEKKVIEQLETNGMVSRNWALKNYISRLGAIMCDLKEWYEFDTKHKDGDYLYILTN